MCCCFCTSFGEQPNFPFYLSLPRPLPCALDASAGQPSTVCCPTAAAPAVWSSSNHRRHQLSWGDTLGGKETEDAAAFRALQCPFAAGVASNARSPVQQETLPGCSRDAVAEFAVSPPSSGARQPCRPASLAWHCFQALHSQRLSGNHPSNSASCERGQRWLGLAF